MTAGGREFQVAVAVELKDRLPMSVHLNNTLKNRTADDRSARVPLHALMCKTVIMFDCCDIHDF